MSYREGVVNDAGGGNAAPLISSAMRRKIHDAAVDDKKAAVEQELPFREKYKTCFILVAWIFCSSCTQITTPFLTKIKADQLGGDQKAGEMQSIIAAAGASVGMLTATLFGTMVDYYGRRPFFILTSVLNIITTGFTVFLTDHIIVSMILTAIASLVQQSFVFAVVADLYSSKMRPIIIAILTAAGTVTSLLAIITTFTTQDVCFYVAFGFTVISLFISFFVPETLHDAKAQRLAVLSQLDPEGGHTASEESVRVKCENPFSAVFHLFKSKVMISCVTILFLYTMSQVGTGDVYMFYLAERVQFTQQDNAYVLVEAGVLQPLVLVVVTPLILRYLSPIMIILFSLGMLIGELVLIATIWAVWPIFALGLPIVALTNLLPPIVYSIVQNNGDDRDQGRRMAGLQAVVDFADAFGPLIFGVMFGNLKSAYIFLPFLVSAGLALIPIGITLRLSKWMRQEAEAAEAAALAA